MIFIVFKTSVMSIGAEESVWCLSLFCFCFCLCFLFCFLLERGGGVTCDHVIPRVSMLLRFPALSHFVSRKIASFSMFQQTALLFHPSGCDVYLWSLIAPYGHSNFCHFSGHFQSLLSVFFFGYV